MMNRVRSSSTGPAGAAWRLATVRTLAWAALFGGWIVLGTLGRWHLAAGAAGQLPVAVWLVAIGVLLGLTARSPPGIAPLRSMLVGAGLVLAVALAGVGRAGGGAALLLAALAWGALLVALSLAVRALRRVQIGRPPAPLLSAAAGAVIAWLACGDLGLLHLRLDEVALSLGVSAAVAAALLPAKSAASPPGACRSGLFDCSLPMPALAAWRRGADWPLQAAALAMLPMMAALPAMSEWCGAAATGGLADVTGWHLGAMAVPALVMRAWLRRADRRTLSASVALLLLAGGAVLLAWPGLFGLTAASLLHGAAWNLAWAGPMLRREDAPPALTCRPAREAWWAALGPAAMTAAGVLGLGVAIDVMGPQALVAVHGAIAALAAAGLLTTAALRRTTPLTPKELSS
jgi:hypothetical protein